MIYDYLNFVKASLIQEGTINNPKAIYWSNQLKNLLNENWTEISIVPYTDKYVIKFKCGDDKYDYYSVIIEDKNNEDVYYMENPKPFIAKFIKEFDKNPAAYVDNLTYEPRCLGDISGIKRGKDIGMMGLKTI